ncbi:HAD family phosphatase [Catenulispora sp. NF23]|uniref:HAD family hydrolase n=1 Tax=Catenulispora pinistramenti TaxID=2705254 RepID=UPI001BAC5460|nr:HAD family phosphatase [Catenulispora pinistramenti]MBS2532102.1 HAD family phosphatase [Catenulispora pinistramenti]
MVAIRAIILDIGGVLEHTPDLGTVARWTPEFGAGWEHRVDPVFRAGEIGTITLEEVHERAAATLGVPVARFEAYMDDVWVEYVGTYNAELAAYWSARRAEGYQTAIISNSFVGAREREEEAHRFSELTDLIVYSHEVGVMKPDPAIYELCLDRLGMRPQETVFVDDFEPNCEAARALGMAAVLFKDTAQAVRDLDALLQKD